MFVVYGYMQMMDSSDEDDVAALLFLANVSEIEKCNKRKTKMHGKRWTSNRLEYIVYHNLVQELSRVDHDRYKNFLPMDMASFEE